MSNQRRLPSTLGLVSTLLSVFLLVGVSPAAFAQIEPATAEMVDSAGTLVGPVLDFTGRPEANVALLIDGHSTILKFTVSTIDTLSLPGGTGVYFASPDCTGQGYAAAYGPGEFLEPQAVGGPNYTFYAGPRSAVFPGPLNLGSALFAGQSCSPVGGGALSNALPVFPVRDLIPYWQPPFRIVNTRGAAWVPAVSTLGLVGIAAALALGGLFLLRPRPQRL